MMNALTKRMASLALPARLTTTRSFVCSPICLKSAAPAAAAADIYVPPQNAIITDAAGRQFLTADLLKPSTRKLKPKVIRKRLEQCKTYEGKEQNIRHSPWRLQLICRHVAGMPFQDAMTELEFLNKRFAPLVQKVLKRTSNLADIRHSLQPSQLEVAECFATQGVHLKRMKLMGRGRQGIMHHKFSHMRVVLREIDFALKIYMARTPSEKKRWIERQLVAQEDYKAARADRDELEQLERMAALKQKEKGDK
jgi:large subunit ribosomal protein L22